jgi:CRISPR-associated protein Cas2
MPTKDYLSRLNAYRVMWLFIFFDLPTETKKDRKNYARFRKDLQEDGFNMMQYSVYTRHCASGESADVHVKRAEKKLPPKGQVSILQITDKQYGDIINFWGHQSDPLPSSPAQLELF